ncbi:innexin, partial [Elysia marginata]
QVFNLVISLRQQPLIFRPQHEEWHSFKRAKVIGSMLTAFANVAMRSRIRDDDVIDQLNHWATVGVLAALAVGTGTKQFVGDPIHCWNPAEYKKKYYQKYADSYCWIHPMYNVFMEEEIPFEPQDRWFNDVGFYRWVFLMFLLQAFFFKVPNILWKQLKNYSGLNVSKIVGMTLDTQMMTQEKRDEQMDHVAIFVNRWLKTYSQYRFNTITRIRDKLSTVFWCFGKRSGTYLTGLYMFTKLLYFVNIIGQFFLLSAFLDLNFWTFGLNALNTFNKKGRWRDYYNFPRVGYCDFKIRQMANVQRYTVQCVLSINMFLEKMYLVVWFWFMFLLIANMINFTQWLFRALFPNAGERFLSKYLLLLGIDKKAEKALFRKFVRSHLHPDGIFMLRIVAGNTSEILTLDLVRHLWDMFKSVHGLKQAGETEADPGNENPKDGGGGVPPLTRQPSAPIVEENDDNLPPKSID